MFHANVIIQCEINKLKSVHKSSKIVKWQKQIHFRWISFLQITTEIVRHSCGSLTQAFSLHKPITSNRFRLRHDYRGYIGYFLVSGYHTVLAALSSPCRTSSIRLYLVQNQDFAGELNTPDTCALYIICQHNSNFYVNHAGNKG